MTTPAGWYPDPEQDGQQRYWDGSQWTEHRAPLVSPPPPEAVTAADGPAPATYATTQELKASSSRNGKTVLIVIGAVVGLLAFFGVVGALTDGDENDAASKPEAAVGEVDESDAPSPTPTESESAGPSPTPEESTAEPKPEKPPKPITYKGSGDRILRIKKPGGDPTAAAIMTITNTNSGSNFVVWTLKDNLRTNDLLVNTIGAYKGTVPLDFRRGSNTDRLQIESTGNWTVSVKSLASARTFTNSVSGKGDDVVVYDSEDAGVANITYNGGSNFVVLYYGGGDLLVNEIGRYKGQVAFTPGPAVVEITASGPWSIRVR